MFDITCKKLPSLKIFINNELFIDQVLPFENAQLVPSVTGKINKIEIFNTGSTSFTVNGNEIQPMNCKTFEE